MKFITACFLILFILFACFLSGCSHAKKKDISESSDVFSGFEDEFEQEVNNVPDPLKPINKVIFKFNDFVYLKIMDPASEVYNYIVAKELRIIIRNFFNNISAPMRIVNASLQLKPKKAGSELIRFIVDSTMGLLGLTEPSKQLFGPPPSPEDFGQTLGYYGIGQGFYLVLPLLGPSTIRDSIGDFGDWYLNPKTYYVDPFEKALAVSGVETLNEFSFKIGEYAVLKKASIKPYEATRFMYITYRNKKIEE